LACFLLENLSLDFTSKTIFVDIILLSFDSMESLVVTYQCLGETYCVHLHGLNTFYYVSPKGTYVRIYTVS
jgi:hypothetical protein